MSASTTFDRVKTCIISEIHGNPDRVKPEASFIDDLGADSLESVGLMMAFEQEFGIEITDDEAEATLTVGQAVALIDSKIKVLA